MMKRLFKNILLFIVAILLLITLGSWGLIYTIISSIFEFKNISVLKYWSDLIFTINVGIDKLGNVLLGRFLNRFAITEPNYPFGNLDDTISFALAKNLGNLSPLGKLIVNILEYLDPGHMENSLKNRT
jgi:hypothetical protein